MEKALKSKTFRSGDSVALLLPEELGFRPEVEVEFTTDGETITLRRKRLSNQELVQRLREIGPPPDGVQERDPFEWPDRPGL